MIAMKTYILSLCLCLISASLLAQIKLADSPNQGIGHASSVFEIQSNQKGFLLPRLSSANRLSIPNPAMGLLLFESTGQRLMLKTQSKWDSISIGGWKNYLILGQQGFASNLSISDSIKVNGFRLNHGVGNKGSNLSFGTQNMEYLQEIGENNIGIGMDVMNYDDPFDGTPPPSRQVAIGNQSLFLSEHDNQAIGYKSIYYGDGAEKNSVIGNLSGLAGIFNENLTLGVGVMGNNLINSNQTVAIGNRAIYSPTTGYFILNSIKNTGIGHNTMENILGPISPKNLQRDGENVSIGASSLARNFISEDILKPVGNIALGNYAGFDLIEGDNNIFLGANTKSRSNTESRLIYIGSALVIPYLLDLQNKSYPMVGIGTFWPNSKAVLTLNSNQRGFLPPRLSKAAINAIASPASGLMVVNKDENSLWVNMRGQWRNMIFKDTIYVSKNMGVSYKLRISDSLKINGIHLGRGPNLALKNMAFGTEIFNQNIINENNLGFGFQTLKNFGSGVHNLAIGNNLKANQSSGDKNLLIGNSISTSDLSENGNIIIGNNMVENRGMNFNLMVGNNSYSESAVASGREGSGNTILGNNIGSFISSITNNSIILGNSAGTFYSNIDESMVIGTYVTGNYQSTRRIYIGNNSIPLISFVNAYDSTNAQLLIGPYSVFYNTSPSAILEISSDFANPLDKGLLPPRLSSNTRLGMDNPSAGLLLYDRNINKLFIRTNRSWDSLNIHADNFIFKHNGLVSNMSITDSIKINGIKIMQGKGNVIIGRQAMERYNLFPSSDKASNRNVAIGDSSMYQASTAYQNTAVGFAALNANTIGANNVAIGMHALRNLNGTTPSPSDNFSTNASNRNVGIGYLAGHNLTSGNNNIAIGFNAQFLNATDDQQFTIASSIKARSMYISGSLRISFGDVIPDDNSMLYVGGIVSSSSRNTSSDERLKTKIQGLSQGLNQILALRPRSYYLDPKFNPSAPQRLHFGFIAQELEQIMPQLVETGSDAAQYKSVNYLGLIPVLTKALQEQQMELEDLDKRVDKLSKRAKN